MTKSKDWLSRNQNNVSECGDMFIRGLLFQWTSTIKNATKRVDIVQSRAQHHLIENLLVLSTLLLIDCWVGVKQQLLTQLTIYPSSLKPNCYVFRKLVFFKSETAYEKSLDCYETIVREGGRRDRDHMLVEFLTEINNFFSCTH